MAEIIQVEDYSFTYSGVDQPALTNVNLQVYSGEIVLIAGSSGCGKSTLLRSLNGLIPHMYPGAWSGSVKVEGEHVFSKSMSELAGKVGYVFQNPENQIFMFSVERDVAFGLENLGLNRGEIRRRVDWAMKVLGVTQLAQRAPHELSDGQKQRVALAGVLAMEPKILLLDEPTSLLDPRTAMEVISLIKSLRDSLGLTVLVVEHRLDLLATIAGKVVVMDKGRVVAQGSPQEVFGNEEAWLVGISVPSATRLHRLLVEDGLDSGSCVISMSELAAKVNRILDD